MNQTAYRLKPVPPFRLDLTVWALRRRPDNDIDRWDGAVYRRALILENEIAAIEVTQTGTPDFPILEVIAHSNLASDMLQNITAPIVQRVLGTQIDLNAFYQFAARDAQLAPLINQFRGVKPPRFPTLFEALVNSISCQQISLNICVRLLNRLAENWGRTITVSEMLMHAFPEPSAFSNVSPDELRKLGHSYNKARAILEIVSLINGGQLNLEEIARMDDAPAISKLMELRGVGPWIAQYSLLRGDGRTHIFPTGDSGAIHNIKSWLGQGRNLSSEEIQSILRPWSPYVGLIYFHLLLRKLSEPGYIK